MVKTGVIAAGHSQTAAAGAEMLQQGGNAVDAAVAAAFASFVSESALVNIGGSGIAQVYNPATGQAVVYDFFSAMPGLSPAGPAPAGLDFRRVLVDFGAAQQPFYIGRGSVAVPGAVAGLGLMLAERGTLPLAQVLAPAIRLAREGVIVTEMQAYITGLLTAILTDTPELAAIYAASGRIAPAGERLRFPQLAVTLERLGAEGTALFYTGDVARQILADQQTNGGLLTETDLATYQVRRSEPLAVAYRDYTILLPPPASDGGVLIAFALELLADQPLPDLEHNGFDHLRTLIEVMRLTHQARAAWERGDSPKTVAGILGKTNLQTYRRRLQATLAGAAPWPEPRLRQGPANTTHLSVADAGGMIVSITTSAGESAGFLVSETGVMLNNMLGEIDLHPNGFHQLPAGQRLATMMSPALVLHRGRPVLAVGSGGSNRLRSAILQTISNVIDFQLPLSEAVEAPRLHFEAGLVQLEGGIAAGVAGQLEAAGYRVNRWPARNMFFGGAHSVGRRPGSEEWTAAGDPRRDGAVVVV